MKNDAKAKGLITTGHHLPFNPKLKERARTLRRTMTRAEKKLWHGFLKHLKFPVLRQKPIDHYIVDFYCAKLKLVIEVDGDSHYTDDGKDYDKGRTKVLEAYKLKVLRFTNYEVLHEFDGVCKMIESEVEKRIPPNPPFNKGGNSEIVCYQVPPLPKGGAPSAALKAGSGG